MPAQPTDEDVADAMAHLQMVEAVGLRRDAGPRCRTCRYYLDPDRAISWCWEPDVRTSVGADWGCDRHAPPP